MSKPLRPASTVIILSKFTNAAQSQFRILFVKRNSKASFFPTAYVFPGGVVEAKGDGSWQSSSSLKLMEDAVVPLRQEFGDTFATRVGGIREVFEEVGLALTASGPFCTNKPIPSIAEARKLVHDNAAAFEPLCSKHGLLPGVSRLIPWAHWITPVVESRRFDTFFYLTALSGEATAASDNLEVDLTDWMTPQDVLAKAAAQQLSLPPPTTYLCQELAQFRTIEDVFAGALSRDMRPILPVISPDPAVKGKIVVSLPGDLLYAEEASQFPVYSTKPLPPAPPPSGLHRVEGMAKTGGPYSVVRAPLAGKL